MSYLTEHQRELHRVYTQIPIRQSSFANCVALVVSKDTIWQYKISSRINRFGFSQTTRANNSRVVNERVFCANDNMLLLYDTVTCGEVTISSTRTLNVVPCSSAERVWLNMGADGLLYRTCWWHAHMWNKEMHAESHLARIRVQSKAV